MRAICVQGGKGGSKKAEKLRVYYINGPLQSLNSGHHLKVLFIVCAVVMLHL